MNFISRILGNISKTGNHSSRITDHDRVKQALYHHHKGNVESTEFASDEEVAIAEQALAEACAHDNQPYVPPSER